MLSAGALVHLRQQSLQWAIGTASAGEGVDSIMRRAETFLHWLTAPLRDDVLSAMSERLGQILH